MLGRSYTTDMKGHKDSSGKFHPHTPYNGVRKSQDQKLKTGGIRLQREDTVKPTWEELLRIKRNTPNPKSDIGLKQFTDNPMQTNFVDDPKREIGNELIQEIIDMSKQGKPELENYKIHSNHVFNQYNTIQKSLYYAKNNVRELIKWRNDNNPETWKWISPICLDDGVENSHNIRCFDDQNLGWVSDGYKGQMALTIMSPKQFLELASPKTLERGRMDIRGDEHTKEITDELTKRMIVGKTVDTPFLQVNKDLKVFSHEGQHRALSAIKAGIKLMPVYVYGNEFTDQQLAEISEKPMWILKPDNRY